MLSLGRGGWGVGVGGGGVLISTNTDIHKNQKLSSLFYMCMCDVGNCMWVVMSCVCGSRCTVCVCDVGHSVQCMCVMWVMMYSVCV